MKTKLGVAAARADRENAWAWGKAVVEEFGWKPPGKAPGGVRNKGEHSRTSLNAYLDEVGKAAGIEREGMPAEQTLRERAHAYYYTRDCPEYRERCTCDAAYQAATAINAGNYEGSIEDLFEEASNVEGRITVTAVKAIAQQGKPRGTLSIASKTLMVILDSTKKLAFSLRDDQRSGAMDPESNKVIEVTFPDDYESKLEEAIDVLTALLEVARKQATGTMPVDELINEILGGIRDDA